MLSILERPWWWRWSAGGAAVSFGHRGGLMSDPYDDRVGVDEVDDPSRPVRRRRRFF